MRQCDWWESWSVVYLNDSFTLLRCACSVKTSLEVYGVLVFPLVALTCRVVASRLCVGTSGEGREIEILHATVCVINLYKRDANFLFFC